MFGFAGDIGDDRGRQRAQIRQVVRDEMVDAVVIQADGVEHPGRRLDGARRRIADARGALVTVLGMMPPSLAKSTTPAISRA